VNTDTSRFVSEIGFVSLPAWPTVCAFLAAENRSIEAVELWHHCKDPGGREKLERCLEPAFGLSDDLRQFCYLSQMLQADALRNAIHQYRHQKWHNRGVLIWQHNDTWPAISWSLVDYFHRPKAAWYVLRRVLRPLHAMLLSRGGVVRGLVTNDGPAAANVTVEVGRVREGSRYQVIDSKQLTVEADTPAVECFSRPVDQFNPVLDLLVTRLLVDGKVVDQDTLLLCAPREFHWPVPRVSAQTELGRDMLTIELTAQSLIYGLEVAAGSFDVRFNDNWLTLLPDEQVTLTVELLSGRATTRDLAGEMELLAYQRGGFVVV
jgi:beta-mannosidase